MNTTLFAAATPDTRMHVVWDWNGTVKDDLDDHVAALNATLPALGGEPVDRETYRAKHTVPIPNFYARLLARSPSRSGSPATTPSWSTCAPSRCGCARAPSS